jgi:hypothetical protein
LLFCKFVSEFIWKPTVRIIKIIIAIDTSFYFLCLITLSAFAFSCCTLVSLNDVVDCEGLVSHGYRWYFEVTLDKRELIDVLRSCMQEHMWFFFLWYKDESYIFKFQLMPIKIFTIMTFTLCDDVYTRVNACKTARSWTRATRSKKKKVRN